MSFRSTGASRSTRAGTSWAAPTASRATSTRRSSSAHVSWWSKERATSSGAQAAARVMCSTWVTACFPIPRSRTCRRSSRPSVKGFRRVPDFTHSTTAVLCMAYGSPDGEEGIEPYFTHIRGGRPPSPEALEELRGRYRATGGSPLTEITRAQSRALAERLGVPVFAGMKHPPPFIAAVRALLAEAMEDFEPEVIFFTAHSLPARIEAAGDHYRDRLMESCRLAAEGMRLPDWEFAFQSASHTGEPWLGPDLLEAITQAQVRRALVRPIGFVADHLEILYDIDIEAMDAAAEQRIE